MNFTVTFTVPQTHAVTSRATYNIGPTGYSYQLCDDVIYTPRGRIVVVVTVIVFWACVSCLKSKVAALHAWVICVIFQMFSSESSHWHMVDNEHFSLCRRWRESYRNLSFSSCWTKLLWKGLCYRQIIAQMQPKLTSPFIIFQPIQFQNIRARNVFYAVSVCVSGSTARLFTWTSLSFSLSSFRACHFLRSPTNLNRLVFDSRTNDSVLLNESVKKIH